MGVRIVQSADVADSATLGDGTSSLPAHPSVTPQHLERIVSAVNELARAGA